MKSCTVLYHAHRYHAIYGSRMATGCLWLSMFTIPRNVSRAKHACVFLVERSIGKMVAFPQTVDVRPEERWGVPSGMLLCSQQNVPVVLIFEMLLK